MRAMRAAFAATVSELLDADDRVALVLAEISVDYFSRAIAARTRRAS